MAYFIPDIIVDNITDINDDILKKFNIKAVLLDIDNTLSPHGSDVPYSGVSKWLKWIKSLGIDIMILSNSNDVRVETFAKAIGIDYYISNAKKPFTSSFNKAIKILKFNREEILLIGDQIFTDILGANIAGIRSALVKAQDKNEPIFIKTKRLFEMPIKIMITYKTKKGRLP